MSTTPRTLTISIRMIFTQMIFIRMRDT